MNYLPLGISLWTVSAYPMRCCNLQILDHDSNCLPSNNWNSQYQPLKYSKATSTYKLACIRKVTFLFILACTSFSNTGPVAVNGVYFLGLEVVSIAGSVLALRFGLVLHRPLESIPTARRMRPVLSWKNKCRSLLERDTTARDVSLRMY